MKFFLLLIFALCLPLAATAADIEGMPQDASKVLMSTPKDAIPAPKQPASRTGNLTGGECESDKDCALGCLANSRQITCLNKTEGSAMCLKNRFFIPAEQSCGCLPDVHHCGFLDPNVEHH